MGATEISESTKKHFGRKLENECGNLLQFEDLLNNKKLFILPKNISKVQLAREVVTVSQQLENRGTASKVKEMVWSSVMQFFQVILHEMSPRPSELCENAVSHPPELYIFLCTLLTSNTETTTEYPQRVRRLVNSFGQDIIYGLTGGRQKPPE